ncbi:MAG: hypothetical protein M1832_001354, partial [Thelocarpon impressellum]
MAPMDPAKASPSAHTASELRPASRSSTRAPTHHKNPVRDAFPRAMARHGATAHRQTSRQAAAEQLPAPRAWPRPMKSCDELKPGKKSIRALFFRRKRSVSDTCSNASAGTTDDEGEEDGRDGLHGVDLTTLCPPIHSPAFSAAERSPSPRPSQLVWDEAEETWLRIEEVPVQGMGLGLDERPGHGARSAPPATIMLHDDSDTLDEPPPCYVQSQLEEASRRAVAVRRPPPPPPPPPRIQEPALPPPPPSQSPSFSPEG